MGDLKIITLQDITAEPVKFLWEPYIPLGKITILQGDGSNGKSTMMLAIAAAVTTGAALPGGERAAPAGVIFQSTEDGLADTIKPKLELFGADCSRVHVIDDSLKALTYADERVEEAIVKMGAKLIVFDPMQAFLGGANMNSANGVRPIMNQLIGVAGRTECAVVILGHLNKRGGAPQYRGLGSIDIFAAARSVLTMGKIPEDENMRAVVHSKSNLATPGPSFATGLDTDGRFVWLGDYDISIDELLSTKKPPAETQAEKAQRFIKAKLARGPVPASEMDEMAKEQGIALKTLRRAKADLGVVSVKRPDGWYWELPVEVEYTVCEEDGQQGQDGHADNVTALTTLPQSAAMGMDGFEGSQDGHATEMTAFAVLPVSNVPGMDGFEESQDGHAAAMTALTVLSSSAAMGMDGFVESQDGHAVDVTTLTVLREAC